MACRTTARQLVVGTTVALSLCGAPAAAAGGHDDRTDARVRGACTGPSTSQLRVRGEDGKLRIEFRLGVRAAGPWRVVLLHERQIVSRATLRVAGDDHTLELRRSVPDWFGTDAVTVRATGPRHETCRAAVTV